MALVGALVSLAALVGTATAGAWAYDPDTVIIVGADGKDVTYGQFVAMSAISVSDVKQAGGCEAKLRRSLNADGTPNDGSTLPLGLDPLISACNEGIAGR
ncbi:hypothetical protein [Nocardia sp. NBC_00511]|uniref:hypothetical protein n=1 Tax=Nocardia sp. NBC_00511 TaxID=2903591 RepID=UPI0030E2C4EB